ncbi:MAG TPA: tRNA preQ1(34) S-adenosylmethionine ribosyltransferase-isomerase QueA [Halothiobacillaceae bacterium]|nr:tRNA preQ1(34) S-adenosylmethionine ribosyltransferase-isomerase QueA [Halothiobacillaceae bacterium]
MKTKLFDYQLPPGLIASRPAEPRESARMMILPADLPAELARHAHISDLPAQLQAGDLLVLNNTRVIPARVSGRKDSGGRVEFLLERLTAADTALCHIRASRAPKIGQQLYMEGEVTLTVVGREGDLFIVRWESGPAGLDLLGWLKQDGHMPLPAYIQRADDAQDRTDYQTVFARHDGAVAAPTAGLHLTTALLEQIKARGVHTAEVTLHVGAGTFQPVRVERIAEHQMHREWIDVPQVTVDAIARTRAAGGRVIAIGTTALRALESAARKAPEQAKQGLVKPFVGDTDLFLYPGQQIYVVDRLLTNFHLPQSTLLMLVSAFAGHQRVLAAYQKAIEQGYRFYSFGDAMLLDRQENAGEV